MSAITSHAVFLAGHTNSALADLQQELKTGNPELAWQSLPIMLKIHHERNLRDVAHQLRDLADVLPRTTPLASTAYSYAAALHAHATGADGSTIYQALQLTDSYKLPSTEPLENAYAIAVLWRRALIAQSLQDTKSARVDLETARHLVDIINDATVTGVMNTAIGWYHILREDWSTARQSFLEGLFLTDYTTSMRPGRLHAELILGLAYIELNAPKKHRMGIFNLGAALLACQSTLGSVGYPYYPLYANHPAAIRPDMLLDRYLSSGNVIRKTARRIPSNLRRELEQHSPMQCANPACRSSIDLHIDHVMFYSWGGDTVLPNLRWLCGRCNTIRKNFFLRDEDALLRLSQL